MGCVLHKVICLCYVDDTLLFAREQESIGSRVVQDSLAISHGHAWESLTDKEVYNLVTDLIIALKLD
jgi:hypothetical protein